MIPWISGNLSVQRLLRQQSGQKLPEPGAHNDLLEQLRELGCQAVEDYVAWAAVEKAPGQFDFEFHAANRDQCRRLGMQYIIYPWVHVLPDWIHAQSSWTRFQCLEHGKTVGWPSIFDSATLEHYDRFYDGIAKMLGPPDAICVGLPVDYGELGYPTGVGAWVAQPMSPHDHVHAGFWAGDRWARQGWRDWLEQTSSSHHSHSPALLERLHRFQSDDWNWNDLQESGWLPTFARYYESALNQFLEQLIVLNKKRFPKVPLTIKVGHGGESIEHGVDPSAVAKIAARHQVTVRTTQATLPFVHQQRLASTCAHFGARYASEPPVNVSRNKLLERVYVDACVGVQDYFEYRQHWLSLADLMGQLRPHLSGDRSRTDVAILFSRESIRHNPRFGFQPELQAMGELLRDRFDFSIHDEAMIRAGSLSRTSVALALDSDMPCQDAVQEFVINGGVLICGPNGSANFSNQVELRSMVHLHAPRSAHTELQIGSEKDAVQLAGNWHGREPAVQFRPELPAAQMCRWTGASAVAYLAGNPGRRSLLEIDGWIHPHMEACRREIRVNGRLVQEFSGLGHVRVGIWLEPELIPESVVQVELCSETMVLADRDLGADRRPLGFVVFALELTSEQDTTAGVGELTAPGFSALVDDVALQQRCDQLSNHERVFAANGMSRLAFLEACRWLVNHYSEVGQELRDEGFTTPLPVGVRCGLLTDRLLFWNRSTEVVTLRRKYFDSVRLPVGAMQSLPAIGTTIMTRSPR